LYIHKRDTTSADHAGCVAALDLLRLGLLTLPLRLASFWLLQLLPVLAKVGGASAT
jgi:hypothetical protein